MSQRVIVALISGGCSISEKGTLPIFLSGIYKIPRWAVAK